MNKEFELSMLHMVLFQTTDDWINEINNQEDGLNFNNQDCYRTAYESCIAKNVLLEEYPPETFSEIRNDIIEDLKKSAIKLIELYEKHWGLFSNYDRRKLLLDTYRKKVSAYRDVNDTILNNILVVEMETIDRNKYYTSTFYKEFGFLLNDYHYEIYTFCQYLLRTINNKFKDYKPFKTFIDYSELFQTFSMKLISEVHEYCNGEQFEELSELDFYKVFNLLSFPPKFKIKEENTKRAYYIIHCFSCCIQEKEIKSYWLKSILHRLGKTENNYKSKYREVASNGATEEDKAFRKDIDKIFKAYQQS